MERCGPTTLPDMPKTALVIEHDAWTPSGMIGEAAIQRGFELVRMRSTVGEHVELGDPRRADIILVTGSAEHWHEVDQHPQLQRELAFVKEALEAGVPIFGMCFGGQALALALGGTVEPSPRRELGWFEIETADPQVIPPGPWFEWHHDRYVAPPSAEILAWNDLCQQAFRHGPHLGLQFHPEVDHEMLVPWVASLSADDEVDAEALLAETKRREPEARDRAFDLFDQFLGGI